MSKIRLLAWWRKYPRKRFLDILLCILALPYVLPVALIIFIALKLESHGPVLWKNVNVGYHNRKFIRYRFRTMYTDLELDLIREIAQGKRHDPRITIVGRMLRRTGLDRLPDLYSVFIGDMSFVGVNTLREAEFDSFNSHFTMEEGDQKSLNKWLEARWHIPPGILSRWSVKLDVVDSKTDIYKALILSDIAYYRERSFSLDLRILSIAVRDSLVARPGAY